MADPISLPGMGGISGDLPQRNRGYTPKKRDEKKEKKNRTDEEPQETAPVVDPNAGLIEALDRLRATGTLGPVENELVRTLRGTVRGSKHYKEDSSKGLPVINDPDSLHSSANEDEDSPPPPPTDQRSA